MPNEADTCRLYVVPKLQAAGWDNEPHRLSEQVTFTDGRIVVTGTRTRRRPGKRADYILHHGIDDGFLAPYRVHHVITQWDTGGWRPNQGDLDRYGREMPNEQCPNNRPEQASQLRSNVATSTRKKPVS